MKLFLPEMPLNPVILPDSPMTDDEFFAFCQMNRDDQIERTEAGEVIIMAPDGVESNARSSDLLIELGSWARRDGTGRVFRSSAGFILPSGSTRSPDAAWIRRERLASFSHEQKRKFLPLCPDFVAEVRSPSDSLTELQKKIDEYIANGARLGWLFDPDRQTEYVYRPDGPIQTLIGVDEISGDPVLPGFVLNCAAVWAEL